MFGTFPPPASGADILVGLDRPRAGLAAYTAESMFLQFVVGDMMGADVVPCLFFAPVYQWVDFKQLVLLIPFDFLHSLAGDRLAPAQTANPGVQRAESPGKRFQFADLAA